MSPSRASLLKLVPSFILVILTVSCNKPKPKQTNEQDFTMYVDPFIGTDGTGHTFPGPSMPFGMVQPGPDNTSIGWDYTSGYQLKDSTIIGFSNTRASGTGISEFGDVLLFPFNGEVDEYKTKKVEETASLGYYRVTLENQIVAELTCSERVAFHSYTYPSTEGKLLINLQHGLRFLTDSLVLDSDVHLGKDKQSLSGYCHNKNWVERKYFFYIQFDQPYREVMELPRRPKENAPKYVFDFDLNDQNLQIKVALSSVDIEGAKKNMAQELSHWVFARVKDRAKREWNTYLGKIEIEAEEPQMRIFYTALYHLFLQPSNIADVDGRYRGADDKVAKTPFGTYYSTLSLWDTYRAAHPLYTILVPERVDDFVNTLLTHHDKQGYLPIWTAWGQENHCMIGNHAIPVIVDAYKKGFRGFDTQRALDAVVRTTTESHLNSNWELYNRYGYYPFDSLDNESVSRTLESGFDDYCVALLASELGEKQIAEVYNKRSSYYKHLFDSETGLMRGKDTKGNFRTPFDPLTPTSPMNNPGDYTEANAWQYSWTPAQYDIAGYTELLGGEEALTKQLNTFFTIAGPGDDKHLGQEGLIGQYAHGNEPSHHVAYLYAYSDRPEKGIELINQIYNQFYDDTPDGITGNDDCGQMSAWYIFTTLGFYPVNAANGTFVLGLPQVKSAKVNLASGNTIFIENNTSSNSSLPRVYWQNDLIHQEVTYQSLMNGGVLRFESN